MLRYFVSMFSTLYWFYPRPLEPGCMQKLWTKFSRFIKSLKYKVKEIDDNVFFKYLPPKNVKKNKSYIKNEKENPFNILKQMNLK